MESTHVLVRPAPRYEHPGQWFGADSPNAAGPPGRSTPPTRRAEPSADAEPPPAAAPPPADRVAVHARAFVVGAMTQVLEAIDRRRPVGQLAEVALAHVVDQVIALQRAVESAVAAGGAGAPPVPTAAVRRVHIQMCGPDGAEFFGSYLRGDRVHAFAGRVELVSVRMRKDPTAEPYTRSKRTELRWRIRSLALG